MSFINKVLAHLETTRLMDSLEGRSDPKKFDECCGKRKGQCPSESAAKYFLSQHTYPKVQLEGEIVDLTQTQK